MNDPSMPPPDEDDKRPLSVREVMGSVFAASIGVQSEEKRARDFARGRAHQYIIAGLVGTILFVLTVYLAVKLILGLATG